MGGARRIGGLVGGVLLLVLVCALSGCAGDHPATARSSAVTRSGSTITAAESTAAGSSASRPTPSAGLDPSGRTWFAEAPPTAPADEQHDTDLGPDKPQPTNGPNDVPAVQDTQDVPAQVGDGDSAEEIEICDLVPLREWQSWSGAADASQLVQEPGEECAYFTPADTVRMTVSVLAAASTSRYLGAAERVKAQRETGLAAPGYWLAGYPASFGATLVVELPRADVVISLYSRDPGHDAENMHAAATRWAPLAQDGVSK